MPQQSNSIKKAQRLPAEAASDTGNVRSVNEDRFWVAPESFDLRAIEKKGQLFVVADGMGGYHAGDVAADIVARTMGESYYNDGSKSAQDIMAGLRFSVQQSQLKVTEEQQRNADHAQMGSTMVAAVVRGDEVFVANVGDARCYRVRNGQLKQLSKDHSWVAEQVAAGVLKPSETKGHPLRSAVTRAIGQPQASPEPDVQRFDWQPNDRLLLCSDGLWDMLPDDKILTLLAKPKAKESADLLVKAANAAGGVDNITVVVVGDLPEPPLIQRLLAPDMLPKVLAGVGGIVGVLLIGLAVALSGILEPMPEPVPTVEPSPMPPPTVAATRRPAVPPTAAAVGAQTSAAQTAPVATAGAVGGPQPTPTLLGDTAPPAPANTAVPVAPAVSPTPDPQANSAATLAGSNNAAAFCSQISGSVCASNQDTFAVNTPNVYVAWTVPAIVDGTRLQVVWFKNGRRTGAPDQCTVRGGRCVSNSRDITPSYGIFRLSTVQGNKAGTYSFQLLLDNNTEPALQGQFIVK